MKKLFYIFILIFGHFSIANSTNDTLMMFSNKVDLISAGQGQTVAMNGINFVPVVFNVGDTIMLWNQVAGSCNYTVNTTPYNLVGAGTFFPINGYILTTADAPSFTIKANGLAGITPTVTQVTITVNSAPTSITKQDVMPVLNLFPNPTKNIFTITNLKTANISVYNQLGDLVKQQSFENENISLNLADLPQGIYMVAVWADNKKRMMKLIKE